MKENNILDVEAKRVLESQEFQGVLILGYKSEVKAEQEEAFVFNFGQAAISNEKEKLLTILSKISLLALMSENPTEVMNALSKLVS